MLSSALSSDDPVSNRLLSGIRWTLLDVGPSHRLPGSQDSNYRSHSSYSQSLFVPLQQHSTAVIRRFLEASVYVFHQQVHSSSVQRAHSLLYVTALKAAQHPHHQQLGPLLHTHRHTQGQRMGLTVIKVLI